jgi:hypothetical protein
MAIRRHILLAVLAVAAGAGLGCQGQSQAKALAAWRGEQIRRDVFLNLMTPVQQANYLLLEVKDKPASLRLAYLQEIGVYQKWVEQPKDMQDAILHRKVLEGMSPVQVQMAWGAPEARTDVADAADRAAGHSKIVWDYVFRTRGASGAYERSVCFYDDQVLWVRDSR